MIDTTVFGLREAIQLDNIEDRFNEILSENEFICTQDEFNAFSNCGFIFKTDNRYITRSGRVVDVSIVTQKSDKLNLDLSGLIYMAQEKANVENVKRVFCMNQSSLDKYRSVGLIIEQKGNNYFRVYDNELWLVVLV